MKRKMSNIGEKIREELLTVCSICNAIKIPNSEAWLRKEVDSELYGEYNNLLQQKLIEKKVSHGYCPLCYEKEREKLMRLQL